METWIVSFFGVKLGAFIAGFVGSVISLRFVSNVETWKGRVSLVASGAAISTFGAPGLGQWLDVTEKTATCLHFLMGVFGMSLLAAIMGAIRETQWAQALKSWITKPGSGA